MTEREKIIALARECHIYIDYETPAYNHVELTNFYHKAQREALEQAAKVCEKKWRKEDSFDSHANAKEIRQLIKE